MSDTTLALFAIAIATLVVGMSRLPRLVVLLVTTSFVGAIIGVLMLLPVGVSTMICDSFRESVVDTCSGTYIGGYRLPEFMQSRPEEWLIGIAAVVGALVADAVALALRAAWSKMRRPERARTVVRGAS